METHNQEQLRNELIQLSSYSRCSASGVVIKAHAYIHGTDYHPARATGPIQYGVRKTANTRPADGALIQRASRFSKKLLRRESGVSQHAIDRFLDGERIHPGTRKRLEETVAELEGRGQ